MDELFPTRCMVMVSPNSVAEIRVGQITITLAANIIPANVRYMKNKLFFNV